MSDKALEGAPGAGDAAGTSGDVVIRRLSSSADFRACVALQKRTWGQNFTECVPPTILKVSQRIGGVAAGAFDATGRLLGFVFGMTGVVDGEAVHWSDMLAVAPEARNLGLGQRLKQFQADAVRAVNVTRIYWTFDPLVARNAHLNLTKLGARVTEYAPDMYGTTDSALHVAGTDRVVVVWRLDRNGGGGMSSRELATAAGDSPILNSSAADGGAQAPSEPTVRIEVPADIEAVQRASPAEAERWRSSTRVAFVTALDEGYAVEGFYRARADGRCYYVLSRRTADRLEGE